ncbi:MAG: arginine deiminase [Bacteroidales bacterium]|nr:arginine deiminase [Bacteroidales bacterium]
MKQNHSVKVNSEIGELEAVIIHTVGGEVENMTPENAERALYSDILNLSVAKQEYSQLSGVLNKVCRVFEVGDLLAYILKNDKVKTDLIKKVCRTCTDPRTLDFLFDLDADELAIQLIEGVTLRRDSLSRFLSPKRYAVKPLHNFFFTRDASVSIGNRVLISSMASIVREREAQIMEAIFDYYPEFNTSTFSALKSGDTCKKISIEGGDVLIANDNLILVGIGSRTTPEGVDILVEKFKEEEGVKHIIVQELPTERESFIHLDMVFTFLNTNECMVFEPVIMQPNRYKTIHIKTENQKVEIREEKNILESLSKLGMDMKPIQCGGTGDPWTQEREQWHSGANFFAIGPGKIIGYNRNVATIEELNKHGYNVIAAQDVIDEKILLSDYHKFVVTIDGSELSRGGGGARCMTMPVRRKEVNW